MVLLNQFSWFWYHSKALNETDTILATTFKLKILKEIYNLMILINNSEKWLTVMFEPSLCQQSTSEVFDLLRKLLDQGEIPLQESKIRFRPLCWQLNDPETSRIWGQFHHLIEHHGEIMNKEQNKVWDFSSNTLSLPFCTLNGSF